MRIIFVGDIHGRQSWKIPAYNEKWDKFVFIGDYFDTREDITTLEQIHNFKEICEFSRNNIGKVVLLIGNHDAGYFSNSIDQSVVSGYQCGGNISINMVLEENKNIMQMCYIYDDGYTKLLLSHAGISHEWLINNGWNGTFPIDQFVNDLWIYQPTKFEFNGMDPYGDNTYQTPIWIRPDSLLRVNRDTLKDEYIQIVGHTAMKKIDIEGKATGGRYYFIDTLGTSGEYLIWEDGLFTTKKVI